MACPPWNMIRNALCRASAILFHLALLLHNFTLGPGHTRQSILADSCFRLLLYVIAIDNTLLLISRCLATLPFLSVAHCTQEAVVVNRNTDATEAMLPAIFILRKGTATSEKVDSNTKISLVLKISSVVKGTAQKGVDRSKRFSKKAEKESKVATLAFVHLIQ